MSVSRPAKVWIAGIGTVVVVNTVVLDRRHDGSTLSECTRMVFRTDTRLGRVAFVATCSLFVDWFVPHILKRT